MGEVGWGNINATVTLSETKSPLLTGCFASLNMTVPSRHGHSSAITRNSPCSLLGIVHFQKSPLNFKGRQRGV